MNTLRIIQISGCMLVVTGLFGASRPEGGILPTHFAGAARKSIGMLSSVSDVHLRDIDYQKEIEGLEIGYLPGSKLDRLHVNVTDQGRENIYVEAVAEVASSPIKMVKIGQLFNANPNAPYDREVMENYDRYIRTQMRWFNRIVQYTGFSDINIDTLDPEKKNAIINVLIKNFENVAKVNEALATRLEPESEVTCSVM